MIYLKSFAVLMLILCISVAGKEKGKRGEMFYDKLRKSVVTSDSTVEESKCAIYVECSIGTVMTKSLTCRTECFPVSLCSVQFYSKLHFYLNKPTIKFLMFRINF